MAIIMKMITHGWILKLRRHGSRLTLITKLALLLPTRENFERLNDLPRITQVLSDCSDSTFFKLEKGLGTSFDCHQGSDIKQHLSCVLKN